MKKENVVKNNREFSNIISKGILAKDKNLVIYYLNNDLNKARFGISVGTKIGKAHIRNNLKRKMRNIVDINKKSYENFRDYIIIVRKNCLEISFKEMQESYNSLLNKLNNSERK